MNIVIRKATPEDAHLIGQVVAMGIGDETARVYCGEHFLQVLEETAAAENTQYSYRNALVAMVDEVAAGAIIGYDGARLEELREQTLAIIERHHPRPQIAEDETQAGEFYLDTIGILPQYRGKGIGARLLKAMRDEAFLNGHQRVGLIVDESNPKAEKLYLSIGFHRLGARMFFCHRMCHLIASPTEASSGNVGCSTPEQGK